MTWSGAYTVNHHDRMTVNNKLARRKQSWCNLRNYAGILLERLRKTTKNGQSNQCPSPNSKSGMFRYKSDTSANSIGVKLVY
jgi:hypothetical protein